MIVAIDIGNTRTKALLMNRNLDIIEKKSWSTPDLFEPERWKVFFDELDNINPGFSIAEKRISCVSWKAFLSLRVFFGYDPIESFDANKPFDTNLLILPPESPFVFDAMVPINTAFVSGLVGSDRLLAAFAAITLYKKSAVVVSLGTATTIDLITNTGVFLGGSILPGIDASYSGLIARASHLPPLSELPPAETPLASSTLAALSSGIYLAHAAMIESLYIQQQKKAELTSHIDLILTGGRAFSISSHIRLPHIVKEDLVCYGLAILPSWQRGCDSIEASDLESPEPPSIEPDQISSHEESVEIFEELQNQINNQINNQ